MLRVRGAGSRDIKKINELFRHYNFPNLDIQHIEMLVVVEDIDTHEIVAVASLTTILEAIFIPSPNIPKKVKIEALQLSVGEATKATLDLGYTNFHALGVRVKTLSKALIRRLGFQKMVEDNLIKFVK